MELIRACFESVDSGQHGARMDELRRWQRSQESLGVSCRLIDACGGDERVLVTALVTLQWHVRNRWIELGEAEKSEVVERVVGCVRKGLAVAVLADVALFERAVIERVFGMEDEVQAVFFVCLVDEASLVLPRYRKPTEISDFMLALAGPIAGLLERIPIEPVYVDLLKRFVQCVTRVEMLAPFMAKFASAAEVLPAKATEFLCDIFDTAPPMASNEAHCQYAQRMMALAVQVARRLVETGEIELAVDLWYSILNYQCAETDAQMEERIHLIGEFLQYASAYSRCTESVFLHSLVSMIATDLSECNVPELKHQLLLLLLELGNREYSEDLDEAFRSLLGNGSSDALVKQMLTTSPGPGLLLATLHCHNINRETLLELSSAAIHMQAHVPFETMLRFISHIGIQFPQLHGNWLAILANQLTIHPIQTLCILADNMEQNEAVKQLIPEELYASVLSFLQPSSPTSVLAATKFLTEFHYPNPLPEPPFQTLLKHVTNLFHIAATSDDLIGYAAFLSELGTCRFLPQQSQALLEAARSCLSQHSDPYFISLATASFATTNVAPLFQMSEK